MDIESATFVVLDTETTGLDHAAGDRICEVGAIKIRGGKEQDRYSSLVHPERELSPEAAAKNGITPEMLAPAPKFAAVAPPFRKFIAGTVLVGQNIEFDMGFLNSEFQRVGMSRLALPTVDTIALARRARPGLASYSLDNLAFQFRITFNARHRSIGDCEATVKVFLECAKILKQKGEARTLEDLIRRGSRETRVYNKADLSSSSPSLL